MRSEIKSKSNTPTTLGKSKFQQRLDEAQERLDKNKV